MDTASLPVSRENRHPTASEAAKNKKERREKNKSRNVEWYMGTDSRCKARPWVWGWGRQTTLTPARCALDTEQQST